MNLIYGIGNIKQGANVADYSCYILSNQGECRELNGGHYSFGNGSFNDDFPLCIARSDDYVVSCDCLLTNKDSLINELELCHDVNDADLILAAFTKWNEDMIFYIEGDFAIAVYGVNSSDIWLFRDHIGVKPLYYSITEEGVYFASNYFLMVESGFVDGKITKESMAFFVDEPQGKQYHRTPFSNISRVLPASYIHFYGGQCEGNSKYKEVKYWNPLKNVSIDKKRNLRQTVRELEQLLVDAVKKRGDIDNVGVHLSGGIDSSSVAGVLSSLKNEKINAYSWSIDPIKEKSFSEKNNREKGSEYPFIDSCCEKYPYDLKYIDYSPEEVFKYRTMPENMLMDWVDEEFVLRKLKEDNINRLLSGWGGDEFFSLRHRVIWFEYFMHPYGLFRIFYCLNKNLRSTLGKLYVYLKYALVPRPFKMLKVNKLKAKGCIIKDKGIAGKVNEDYYSFIFRYFKNTKNKLAQKKLDLYLLSYRMETWNAYAYTKGVEYSFPLLDKNVVEFMFSIPTKYWASLKYNRFIARLASRNYIPDLVKKNNPKDESGRIGYMTHCYDEIYQDVIDGLKDAKDCELLSYIDIEKLIKYLTQAEGTEKYLNIVKGLQVVLLHNIAKKYSKMD